MRIQKYSVPVVSTLTNIAGYIHPGEGGNVQGMEMLASLSPEEVGAFSLWINVI